MSKYTTELRYICETKSGYTESQDADKINEIVSVAQNVIFDNYPIFDEAYREVLNNKILKHYYTREIGYETYGLWRFKLNTKMNEIMPYYNEMYKANSIKFNPLYNFDISTVQNRTSDSTIKGNTDSEISGNSNVNSVQARDGNSKNDNKFKGDTHTSDSANRNISSSERYSDTPQGGLEGIESNRYLTNATLNNSNEENANAGDELRKSESQENKNYSETLNNNSDTTNSQQSSTNTNNKIESTDDYINVVKGVSNKSKTSLLVEYRQSLINIDMLIIDELSDLFMNIW